MRDGHPVRSGLHSTLAALSDTDTALLDPVRFRYLLALVEKAQAQRSPVAAVLENKAATALERYLDDYKKTCEVSSSVAPGSGNPQRRPGVLAELTAEVTSGRPRSPCSRYLPLDAQWQQQEQTVLRSVADNPLSNAASITSVATTSERNDSGAMQQLRESLHRGHTQRRIQQIIQEGPANPGPLNPEGLIVRSLTGMQGISASYTHRLVDYLDSLLWLDQASRTRRKQKKGSGKT